MRAIQATKSLYQASLILSYLFLSCVALTGEARELTETKVISYLRPVTDAQAETKITTGLTAASLANGLEHRASSTYAYSLLNTVSVSESIETSTTSPDTDEATLEPTDEEDNLNITLVEQVLYPEEVLLKAHSPLSLEEHYTDIFAETSTFLTTCLENVYSDFLQAYKLTIEYTEGPDTSELGVVVTNMNVSVVLSVLVETIEEYGTLSQGNATTVVLSSCFTTSKLYQFLGALRIAGMSVNELTLQEDDFMSPIFDSEEPTPSVNAVEGTSSGSLPDVENKKSRVGLFMGLLGGLLVLGSVFYAQKRGMPQPHSDSIGNVGKRIRRSMSVGRLKLESFSDNVKAKFLPTRESEDTNSSSLGEEESLSGTRERTWSGSFRRHPAGGVKPAALQKTPAFSKDYLKSPVQDDFSFSVGGDYNVPDQYEFQATPMSSLYNAKIAAQNQQQRREEEFSMPDEYTSVREDASSSNVASLKSQSPPGVKIPMPYNSYKGYGQHLASPQGKPAPPGSHSMQENSPASTWSCPTTYSAVTSSKEPQHIDEWSVNSFSTSTPAEGSTKADESPVPYRHWSPSQRRGSPGSSLAMPKLK